MHPSRGLRHKPSHKGVVHIDVIMLAHNLGGKERTHKGFEALAMGASFHGFKVVCCKIREKFNFFEKE